MNNAKSARSDFFDFLQKGVLLGAAVLALILPPVGATSTKSAAMAKNKAFAPAIKPKAARPAPVRVADFGNLVPSEDARLVANWSVGSGDSKKMSFVIVDKKDAKVYVFTPEGRLKGATPVLLGYAAGDDTIPGIGDRPLSQVRPEERTTPAGRFIAEMGVNTHGEDIVWVDYDAAVSMHRVRAVDPSERRLERLASPTPDDNRISYGCINLPPAFYEGILKPTVQSVGAVIYVLPEIRPVREIFGATGAAATPKAKVP